MDADKANETICKGRMKPILYYVPVIHVISDLGSLGPIIERRRREICPGDHWDRHKAVVEQFWNGIAAYFRAMNARNLKIYQDGMMTDGELGLKIIREGAASGSRNHQVVLDLLERGARLQKTEDIDLLKEEYHRTLMLAQRQSRWESIAASLGRKAAGDDILDKRDRFMAETLTETLRDGEKGVLFVGAFHDVLKHLAGARMDIRKVKDPVKVREYFHVLLTCVDDRTFEALVDYMVKPPGQCSECGGQ